MIPESSFPQSTSDVDIPDSLWKAKTPIARQVAAAELWLNLTTAPPKKSVVESQYDSPETEYEEKEAAFLKVATTVGEISMRGKPPLTEPPPDVVGQAMAEGETLAQQQMMAAQAGATAAPKKSPKKAQKPEAKKDSKSGVTVNVNLGEKGAKKEAALKDILKNVWKFLSSHSVEKTVRDISKNERARRNFAERGRGKLLLFEQTKSRNYAKQAIKLFDKSNVHREKYLQALIRLPKMVRRRVLAAGVLGLGVGGGVGVAGTRYAQRKQAAGPVVPPLAETKAAAAPVIGAAIGGAGAASLAGYLQYLKSIEQPGGKSREELSNENDLNQLQRTLENEQKSGRLSELKKKYYELRLKAAQEDKKHPKLTALKGAVIPGIAGAWAGHGIGKALTP